MSWQEQTLKDICIQITDGAHNSPKSVAKGLPMASVKDLTPSGITLETCRLISEVDFLRLAKQDCMPKLGDVLIAKDGASALDTVCEFRQNFDVILLSSIAILRPNTEIISSSFLRYYLDNPLTRTYMKNSFITGAAIPRVVLEDFKRVIVRFPPLPIQRKIAAILSAYDDLIENNTRRIKILEEMAQTIYREWFVHYRFPGHEQVKLVDSGTELGMVPEGWEVLSLDKVLRTLESGSRPKGGINQNDIDIPSIGAENILGLGKYDYSKDKFVSYAFFKSMKKGVIEHKDVLLYKDGASLGRKSMFRDDFPYKICCINEHVFILRTNDRCTQNYLYFWLDLPVNTQAIINLNTNAAQPGISQEKVKSLMILIPDPNILNVFESFIEPILGLLFNLAKKNNILQNNRDLLLPRLISGELDVSEMEIPTV